MQKYNLQWHSAVKMSKIGDNILLLELGIFSLKLEKKPYFFVIKNMTQYQSPKWTRKNLACIFGGVLSYV